MYVELDHINKSFGSFKASDDISFGIGKGKLIALLGPSGSGKTTILRMIAGLETPDSGSIIIDGQTVNGIPASKRGIGFVFQNYALFRYMNVYENIAFGLKIQKKSGGEIKTRVTELIKTVGLEGLEKRFPNQLSGGQRQRVAFARAIAPNPHLLLLDEPFAAVDAKVRLELRRWLKNIIGLLGITSIFVTHDQDEAVEIADEIIVTNRGKIEQIGAPIRIYEHPETPFVAQFIGDSVVINDYGKFIGFENESKDGRAVIRPEFIEAFKSDNVKYQSVMHASEEGVIVDIAFRGSHLELTISVKNTKLTVNRSLERRPVEKGEKMRVLIYRMYIFLSDSMRLVENDKLKEHALID
jgi:ABC-type spermidine/putrescine transport systems, ATPase components